MGFLDGIFGAGASQSILGSNPAQQSSYSDALDSQRYAQMQSQYTQAQMNRYVSHKWVFNGKPCTLHEFADAVWPGEHEDKMLFLLTHSGPDAK